MPWPPVVGDVLPLAEYAYGIRRKLVGYSLNRAHDRGGDKARAFQLALGIELSDVDHLIAELKAGALSTPTYTVRVQSPRGFSCGVRIPVRGVGLHRNRVLPVTTGWELSEEGAPPRLVSAYLKG